jgi:signal recognition particle GTPase
MWNLVGSCEPPYDVAFPTLLAHSRMHARARAHTHTHTPTETHPPALTCVHADRSELVLKGTNGGPAVIYSVGVNGAGKTTTIGKLASKFGEEGAKVGLGVHGLW